MSNKISIIVPIYKVESYINKCIDSILAQTYNDFELILVNDGSPDNCGEICEEYAKKDKRIRVIHKKNGGVSSARNKGIEIAKGDYIGFVDPDDTIEPTMYEELLKAADYYNADMVICPIKSINLVNNTTSVSSIWKDKGQLIGKQNIINDIIPSLLLGKTYSLVSSVNKLYKKSIFDSHNIRFDENKHHSEDVRLNFTLLTLVDNLLYVEKAYYKYYIRNRESLTKIFRADLYDYILDNKNFLIELSKQYKQDENIESVKNHFTKVTLLFMQNVAVKKDISAEQRYEIVSTIMEDSDFAKDILIYKCPSIFYKLLTLICIKKDARLFINALKFKTKLNILRKNQISIRLFGTKM
ncbi:hypothetical protein CFK37_16890 [Virgibacillus phasianinus]|uniref:Glycosyltransferase 2-like domain-containing protein n=1 Tax=Virgibacillus phasianinus TaxID=2017483 RepID=A0A220U5X7_9BACI|nr:glycosyltransferase [Virgibacillus phasianinus]ASK63714.1 hypothetical protein CFK37_16890 [Virgibacillus phasianinus]